ncbi:MAG: aldehyde-activating protein [Mesorhizobium amorphae]|nr:MAG: aldehyde-activating protein [Mesorhizobium amorphae]
MSLDNRPIYAGGCQCGAVRFRIEGALRDASVCHCRMCQKAFGSFYAPLVTVDPASLRWTRGEPKLFRSSNHAQRGFCGDCGTPLSYMAPEELSLAIGAFDDPASIAPVQQWDVESKLPYVDDVTSLPAVRADESEETADIVSLQHPDFETTEWPLHDRKPA